MIVHKGLSFDLKAWEGKLIPKNIENDKNSRKLKQIVRSFLSSLRKAKMLGNKISFVSNEYNFVQASGPVEFIIDESPGFQILII